MKGSCHPVIACVTNHSSDSEIKALLLKLSYRNGPHGVEDSPGTFPCSPRNASVQGEKLTRVIIKIPSATHNKPPSREEGETVIKSWFRQVWDRADGRVDRAGGEREEVDALEGGDAVPPTDGYMP